MPMLSTYLITNTLCLPLVQMYICSTNNSLHALEKKEISCHESAEKSIAALNFNVSPEIQALYDRLSFIFPCRWDGENIIGINIHTIISIIT